ncbi:transglycosylase SLT domain-containing protein [Aliagarivorans marinus]|uniref:transglycosylase SLT domain-containing protein n=1 Tax=Aliagarivorans marinus TaxID=561965 RepID=UPI00041E9556|nr:transporter substrate-binding domain-containing protein [Aliagarivorans marinus]
MRPAQHYLPSLTTPFIALLALLCCWPLWLRAEQELAELPSADPELYPFYVDDDFTGDLDALRERKVIRALVTYGKSDFYIANGEMMGIQVELLRHYEAFLNQGIRRDVDKVKVKLLPVNFDQLLPYLQQGKGDIAAAFLTATPERSKQVSFALGNAQGVSEILVSNTSQPEVTSWGELSGKEIHVLKGSSYVEHLKALNLTLQIEGKKPIKIVEADEHLLSEDLLELVNAGVIPRTLIDDYKAQLWQKVYPQLRLDSHLQVSREQKLGWAVRKDNPQLLDSVQSYVASKAKQGSLLGNMLLNRYFDQTAWIADLDEAQARDRIHRYLPYFEKYAEEYSFNSLALIAQAFQESKLDNSKVSHRGAKGIMQLLPATAKQVGINDLNDPEQNILAGVRYLDWLREHYLPMEGVDPSDQMAMLWAGYNAGPSKLKQMRKLAAEMGLDANRWFGNVEIAAGRIIGSETVRYVSNVYKYYVAYSLALETIGDS